ncbi:MAG TPA: hypothetical protein VGF67_26240 [Ktedonobacteraceae bacterium]
MSQRSLRAGAILSLLGNVLAICGIFFLPMAIGAGGGSVTPHAEWEVATFFFRYLCGAASLVAALPLLLGLVVLGMSALDVWHKLSPNLIGWRRLAALVALVLQGGVGFFMIFIYTFGFGAGAGFWVALLGFVVLAGSTFLS